MRELNKVKGVGPKTYEKFKESSIDTIEDLLLYFPKNYKVQEIKSIHMAKLNESISISARILDKPKIFFFRKNLSKMTLNVFSEGQKFKVDIFNRHFLAKVLFKNVDIVVTGKFRKDFRSFLASEIVLKKNYKEGIIPEYKIKDIKDGRIRNIISNIFEQHFYISETLPDPILDKRDIDGIQEVVSYIHLPQTKEQLNKALYRLKYQELLEFAIRIELIRKQKLGKSHAHKSYDIAKVKNLIKDIKFELTPSQKQATNEIFKDLKSSFQMNRLLQGDVGSGKTIVSILAAYACVTADHQVAVMAPTLVLANQHYKIFNQYLEKHGVKVEILTSETKNNDKKILLEKLASGHIDIIIGTHALIQEDIDFSDLGLAVIDEQHRFGVEQRKKLREKGYEPDLLLMSATPIPRTLAISIFESSDISQIIEKPVGRIPVKTKILEDQAIEKVYKHIEKEINLDHQVFVVCPLIHENEDSPYYSVEEMQRLLNKRFGQINVGILHGQLDDSLKRIQLERFKNKDIKILVSTTVVEVGVHVDDATLMVIMNANAFGLAQLHQLRGRIGRNDMASHCYLVINQDLEDQDRLKILEKTDDGFEISAYDLKLRGPGEVFGRNQAGIPNFNFANLINDDELLKIALEDARDMIHMEDSQSKRMINQVKKQLDSYHLD
jgi:ATP-dependent DNA helicase RecG